MNKEFTTYEQALVLKELGFNEKCFCYFDDNKELRTCIGLADWNNDIQNIQFVPAPLYQQAFRWFRENYGLYFYVDFFVEEKFDYVIVSKMYDKHMDYLDGKFDTYEEAELVGLKRLIQIVKSL